MSNMSLTRTLALSACLATPLAGTAGPLNLAGVTLISDLTSAPVAAQLISVVLGEGVPLATGLLSSFPVTPLLINGGPMLGQLTGPLLDASSMLGEFTLPGL